MQKMEYKEWKKKEKKEKKEKKVLFQQKISNLNFKELLWPDSSRS